jgi:hypothetical protein
MAAPETFGGIAAKVRSGVVYDKQRRVGHEVDVAVFDPDDGLLAIGESKWGEVLGTGHLGRLEKTADLLAARNQRPRVIVLFSGAGFTADLQNAAAASGNRIQLVDLDRLYTGD